MTYDPKANYCTLSPDKPFGVDISYGCYLHDRQYRNEVKKRKTRFEADRDLQMYIEQQFNDAGKQKLGWIVSAYYLIALRLFCWIFWKKK